MKLICPACSDENDTTRAVGGEYQEPSNGDVVVCPACGLLSFIVDASTGECRAAKDQAEFDEAVVTMMDQLSGVLTRTALIEVDRRVGRVWLTFP